MLTPIYGRIKEIAKFILKASFNEYRGEYLPKHHWGIYSSNGRQTFELSFLFASKLLIGFLAKHATALTKTESELKNAVLRGSN